MSALPLVPSAPSVPCAPSAPSVSVSVSGVPRSVPAAGDDGVPARSAAAVNMRIRALWARAGGPLSPADQDRYQRLLEEWAAAVRADVVEAA